MHNGSGKSQSKPTVRGEIIITIDEDRNVEMGTEGQLTTDDVVFMIAKAKLAVDAQVIEKMLDDAMMRKVEKHSKGIQLPPPGFSSQG